MGFPSHRSSPSLGRKNIGLRQPPVLTFLGGGPFGNIWIRQCIPSPPSPVPRVGSLLISPAPPPPQIFYTSPCTRWSPSTPPVSQSRGSAHGRTIAATPLPTHSPISDTSCSRPLSHAHDGPRRRRVKVTSQWRRVGVMPRVPRIRVASPSRRSRPCRHDDIA